ncbi:NADP-dependent oxidoreductase [Neobacillus niacini]|uniref:NADP-dependent oxidoreductase n=1 Tax=Neobacillus niacini TaxID=86668 RepID=UPI002FFD7B0A
MNKSMKAYLVEEFDNNDTSKMQIATIDVPTIQEDEVLIQIAGTSFNPADRQVAAGEYKDFFSVPMPYVIGMDGSGVVVEIGNKVTNVQVNDRVFSYLGYAYGGGAGEFAVTKASNVAQAPKNIPLSDAATATGAALTAWETLFENGKLEPGQKVIVNGASGGVGSFVVQLAKWKGAYVIGVDAPEHLDAVKMLGADQVVNYKVEKAEEVVEGEVDLIINFSNAPNSQIQGQMSILKKGGIVVNGNAASAQDMFQKTGGNQAFADGVVFDEPEDTKDDFEYIVFAVHPDSSALTRIAELIDEGMIKPYITKRIDVSQLHEVHNSYLKGQNVGKVAVIVNDQI